MKILALWLVNYYSGNGEQFFRRGFEAMGHEVDVCALDQPASEARLLDMVEKKKYDFIFHIPYKENIRPEVLRHISMTKPVVTLCWNGDDEWLWGSPHRHNPERVSPAHNWTITTHQASLEKYRKAYIDRVILAQWGFSDADWKFQKTKKDLDVYFCGAKTPERDILIRDLRDNGIRLDVDGPGYGNYVTAGLKAYNEPSSGGAVPGKVPFSVMLNRYRRAKIAINPCFNVKEGKLVPQIKARTFEVAALKTFQIIWESPDLFRFFKPGKECGTFKSSEDLVKKVRYYLAHEKEREAMAQAAYMRNKAYAFEKIFKPIFEKTKAKKIK